MWRVILFLSLTNLLAGCAHYEFDLLEPASMARHIGSATETAVREDFITYHFQAGEGRLVVQAYNTSDNLAELIGAESYVVDPQNQSRKLASQTVAPHSFIKFILPPLRPFYRMEPAIGIGFEANSGSADRQPGMEDVEPRYVGLVDTGQTFWTWDDESTVKLRLVWKANEKMYYHEFTFARRKV